MVTQINSNTFKVDSSGHVTLSGAGTGIDWQTTVDNIIAGVTDKSNLWAVNTEMEYHEEKQQEEMKQPLVKEPKEPAEEVAEV